MNRNLLVIAKSQHSAAPDVQSFIDELLMVPNCWGGSGTGRSRQFTSLKQTPEPAGGEASPLFFLKHAHDNLYVMLSKSVESKGFIRPMYLSVGPKFGIAMLGGPLGDFRVETFPVFHHWREQEQVAAPLHLRLEHAAELIAGLCLDGYFAIRTVLGANTREEQAEKMIDLRHRCDSALATSARVALLDTNSGRNSGDEINIGTRELFHKLPRVRIHGIEKPALPLGKKKIERERALARAAHAGDDHEFIARDCEREIFEVVLSSSVDRNRIPSVCHSAIRHVQLIAWRWQMAKCFARGAPVSPTDDGTPHRRPIVNDEPANKMVRRQ